MEQLGYQHESPAVTDGLVCSAEVLSDGQLVPLIIQAAPSNARLADAVGADAKGFASTVLYALRIRPALVDWAAARRGRRGHLAHPDRRLSRRLND